MEYENIELNKKIEDDGKLISKLQDDKKVLENTVSEKTNDLDEKND